LVWTAHGGAEAALREEQRVGATVVEWGNWLVEQLREDAVELTARWVQAEQLQRSGTTVSSCSPAFGR
jgi:tRNA A37 threonylcarbamoyladenosine biosynthesis protein TsaE